MLASVAGDEKKRSARARRLRAEIERLRSGGGEEGEPKSPRGFLDRAAREAKRQERESDREGRRED